MTRNRFCAVFVVLLVMDTVRAEEPSWKCWCDPAIQRGDATKQEPANPAEPQQGEANVFFGETLEKTADQLYAEAVRLDDQARSLWAVLYSCYPPEFCHWSDLGGWHRPVEVVLSLRAEATDKFITLLEQCPSYPHRDDVVNRLRVMADGSLDDAQAVRLSWREGIRVFLIPRHSPKEQAEMVRDAQARARKVEETVEKTVSARSLDGDTFTWGPALFDPEEEWRFAEEFSRIAERLDGPPAGSTGGDLSDYSIHGGRLSILAHRTPASQARGTASSRLFRQIIMRLQCDPPDPPFFKLGIGFEH
jgi:hypothetical protein